MERTMRVLPGSLGRRQQPMQAPVSVTMAQAETQPPEPFVPVVVVSPNNVLDIARRISLDRGGSGISSPFGRAQGDGKPCPAVLPQGDACMML
jgi:hypothetical protein